MFVWDLKLFFIELKWTEGAADPNDVDAFVAKVGRKLAGTLGVFWSVGGFSKAALDRLAKASSKRVLLFDRSDLEGLCLRQVTLPQLLAFKWRAASEEDNFSRPWSEISAPRKHKLQHHALIGFVACEAHQAVLDHFVAFIANQVPAPRNSAQIIRCDSVDELRLLVPGYLSFMPPAKILFFGDRELKGIEKEVNAWEVMFGREMRLVTLPSETMPVVRGGEYLGIPWRSLLQESEELRSLAAYVADSIRIGAAP